MAEKETDFTHEAAQKAKTRLKLTPRGGVAVGLAVGLAAGVATPELIDTYNGPEFHGSVEYTVMQGDTLWGIVGTIDGHESADRQEIIDKILSDPANTGIGTDLQPGQVITIPIEIER